MWFVGLLVGLFVGAAFGSLPLALVCAVVGAAGAAPLLRALRNRPAAGPAVVAARWMSEIAPESAALVELRRQVDALSRRVVELEQAAFGAAGPEADATAAATIPGGAVFPAVVDPVPTRPAYATTPVGPERSGSDGLPQPAAARSLVGTIALDAAQPVESAVPPSALEPEAASESAPASPAAPAFAPPPPRSPPRPWRERLPAPLRNLIFGGNTLVKVGVLILFLGLAFLLSYTAERVTVPVEVRYALVALVGAGLLALGWLLRGRRRDYALILQGAGIGVFYLTTLTAMKLSELLPPTLGFAFLFAVAVLSAVLAVLQNAPVLAIVAALEGFAAPVLASTGANRPVALFTYLLVLDLGIFLVAWFKAWRPLNLIGLVGTFTLAAGWAHRFYSDDQYGLVQPFLIVFFLLFAAIGLLFARRTLAEAPRDDPDLPLAARATATLRRVGRVDSSLVFGAPMAAFGLQYLLMRGSDLGAAFSALAFGAFYLGIGRLVFATQPRGLALLAEAYAIVGVIFATLAIPLGLEGQWTGATWAIEAAGMYWLGIRQQRPYSRAFAFALVIGAVAQLLRAVSVVDGVGLPLLHGSLIGPVMMAGGAFAMWLLQRRARLDQGTGWEALAGAPLPWIGVAALTLLPWQTLTPPVAATATALMSLAIFGVSLRFGLAPLRAIVHALQLLAVLAFIATLQSGHADAGVAIEGGRYGTLQAALIVLSVLATTAWSMRLAHRAALATGIAPVWTFAQIAGALAGVGLLHLAMLLAFDLDHIALVWPVTALIVLWVALRISHKPLAALAAVVQAAAAAVFVGGFLFGPIGQHGPELPAFANLGFWTPLALGITALIAGDWLRGEARHAVAADASTAQRRWPNEWCARPAVLRLPVVWGLVWWLAAFLPESWRVLSAHGRSGDITAATVGVLIATSLLASAVAARRDWRELGRAMLATLSALVLAGATAAVAAVAAVVGIAGSAGVAGVAGAAAASSGATDGFLPSAGFGWLAWPIAFAWHLRSLRLQERWTVPARLGPWHIAGVWFFLLLAARECQLQFARLGSDYSAWPLLGWVLVPALVLWALRSRALLRRWPLASYRRAYLDVALAPVAAYLFGWCWLSNVLSPGDAAPLPYLPLVNPLELAQALVLVALALWWRAQSPDSALRVPGVVAARIAAVTGWALLTGIVLRSCHHYLGVPWEGAALYASWPTQAALSLAWTICGVLAMVLGHRRGSKPVWIAGAVLIGIVVLKLFFVEFADRGGLFRIVSFIGVGALLLMVGYFAPVPPGGSAMKEQAA